MFGTILYFNQNLVFTNFIHYTILFELSGFWPEK